MVTFTYMENWLFLLCKVLIEYINYQRILTHFYLLLFKGFKDRRKYLHSTLLLLVIQSGYERTLTTVCICIIAEKNITSNGLCIFSAYASLIT